jgi:glutamine---fructose-6-phosphate transaminase (isomerizing)
VAAECSLKLAELTGLPAEAHTSYEYRHGPRMWADEGTLALVLSGVRAVNDEKKAAKELLSFGSSVIWFGKGEGAGECFDVQESSEIDAIFRKSFAVKMCGVSFGRRLSRDFDHPAHLLHSVKEL